MSTDNHQLDPFLLELLDAERKRPLPPENVGARVHARVLAAIQQGGEPDGGGPDGGGPDGSGPDGGAPGGTPAPGGTSTAPGTPAALQGAASGPARVIQSILPRAMLALIGGGGLAAGLWLASSAPPGASGDSASPAGMSIASQAADSAVPVRAAEPVTPSAELSAELPAHPLPGESASSSTVVSPPVVSVSGTASAAPAAPVKPRIVPPRRQRRLSELELLQHADQLAAAGDTSRALSGIEVYQRTYPHGQLGEEAAALQIELLVKNGSHADARRKIGAFRRNYPDGAQLPRVLNAESKLP